MIAYLNFSGLARVSFADLFQDITDVQSETVSGGFAEFFADANASVSSSGTYAIADTSTSGTVEARRIWPQSTASSSWTQIRFIRLKKMTCV